MKAKARSGFKKFCAGCGKEDVELIKGFCTDCYLKENKIFGLPPHIEVSQCKSCSRIEYRGNWFPQSRELLEKIVRSSIKLRGIAYESSSVSIGEDGHEGVPAKAEVIGRIGEKPIALRAETLLKSAKKMCDSCMRASSYYHEAILQVRFSSAPSESQLASARREIERNLAQISEKDGLARIIDVKVDRKGADYLIGSKRAAKRAADSMARGRKGKVITSNIVTGLDSDGKTKKRFVFCVRV